MIPAPDPAAALAEGLALHVERWSLARCGDTGTALLARRAAHALSQAIAAGHVCLRLADLQAAPVAQAETMGAEEDLQVLSTRLRASGVVGTPEAPDGLPLILDADGRLYLHRHFEYERRLARRLRQAAGAAPKTPDAATLALLRRLFDAGGAADDAPDWQMLAAALALRQQLVVVSGGPGTGKTSTVLKLLACLVVAQGELRVALAAPTGKAAARLGDALRQGAGALPPGLREHVPLQATTVHRLLGARPGGFAHHGGNPLPIDVLVVDEASMLDLALATKLLEAVPPGARIVLLGDKDQLAAVEAGAVFAELSADPSLGAACRRDLAAWCGLPAAAVAAPPVAVASPLQDAVVWFARNYRFAAGSGIARAAADIRQGRAADLLKWLRDGVDDSVRWLPDDAALPAPATWACISAGYAPFFELVQREPGNVAALLQSFDRFRVLCAHREGRRGVVALNEQLTREARSRLGADAGAGAQSPWYAGRPVMVLRNDPLLKLFNGDVGISLPDASGALQVHFADPAGGFRAVAPVRLPAHETAYAMTVHKAQGSEFDALLLLLPERPSAVLTRELLYTALTRARRQALLAGSAAVLTTAIEHPTRRHSGLLARLRQGSTPCPDAVADTQR